MNEIIQIDAKQYGLTETKAKEVAAMFKTFANAVTATGMTQDQFMRAVSITSKGLKAARQAELAKGDDQIMDDLRDDIADLIRKYTGRFKFAGYYSEMWIMIAEDLNRASDKCERIREEQAR